MIWTTGVPSGAVAPTLMLASIYRACSICQSSLALRLITTPLRVHMLCEWEPDFPGESWLHLQFLPSAHAPPQRVLEIPKWCGASSVTPIKTVRCLFTPSFFAITCSGSSDPWCHHEVTGPLSAWELGSAWVFLHLLIFGFGKGKTPEEVFQTLTRFRLFLFLWYPGREDLQCLPHCR